MCTCIYVGKALIYFSECSCVCCTMRACAVCGHVSKGVCGVFVYVYMHECISVCLCASVLSY